MRRDLGYSPEEVDRMPWWQLLMFVEQINRAHEAAQEEGTGPEKPEVVDDLSDIGITPQTIA